LLFKRNTLAQILSQIGEIAYCVPITPFSALHHIKWTVLFDRALHYADYGRSCNIALVKYSIRDGYAAIISVPYLRKFDIKGRK
jgi:hypothetical protein